MKQSIHAALKSLSIGVIFCLLSGISLATGENPITWSLKLSSTAKSVKPGGKFTAVLQAEIKPGWHLYSTTQAPGGPIPTRITLAAEQPFELAGTIEGPSPQAAFDKNFGINTEWYDASATFKIPVKLSARATPGKQKLKVNAFFQSCSATLCLPPVTEKLEAFVDVAPKVRGRK